jgi:16S rRNA (cytosine1402-N4)-methyltransferase
MESYQKEHVSVMPVEVVSYCKFDAPSVVIDATFGAGGHTKKLLDTYLDMKVVGVDWDKKSLEQFGSVVAEQYGERFSPLWGNFAHLYKLTRKEKIIDVDCIIADFGTSQMQIFEMDGFSFQNDTPLDMRMAHGHYIKTAADIVNSYMERDLADLFWEYSQEVKSKAIARAIVFARHSKKIRTTKQLVDVILSVSPWNKKTKIHPATRVFQALRMAVNHELENITAFLHGAFGLLKPGGRLICISFHSLEDGLVKDFFLEKESLLKGAILTKKPITPTEQEISKNPSSRSAKLRVFQKN